jgi:hypothetical protein
MQEGIPTSKVLKSIHMSAVDFALVKALQHRLKQFVYA